MNRNELPKTYKGYLTAELLELLDKISGGLKEDLKIPPEKMIVLGDLTQEYLLTPEARAAAGMIKFNPRMAATVN